MVTEYLALLVLLKASLLTALVWKLVQMTSQKVMVFVHSFHEAEKGKFRKKNGKKNFEFFTLKMFS